MVIALLVAATAMSAAQAQPASSWQDVGIDPAEAQEWIVETRR